MDRLLNFVDSGLPVTFTHLEDSPALIKHFKMVLPNLPLWHLLAISIEREESHFLAHFPNGLKRILDLHERVEMHDALFVQVYVTIQTHLRKGTLDNLYTLTYNHNANNCVYPDRGQWQYLTISRHNRRVKGLYVVEQDNLYVGLTERGILKQDLPSWTAYFGGDAYTIWTQNHWCPAEMFD